MPRFTQRYALPFNSGIELKFIKICSQNETQELNRTMDYCRTILLSSSTNPALTEGLHWYVCRTLGIVLYLYFNISIFSSSAGNAIYSIPPLCMSIERLLLPASQGNENFKANEDQQHMLKPVMVLVDILKIKVMNVRKALCKFSLLGLY